MKSFVSLLLLWSPLTFACALESNAVKYLRAIEAADVELMAHFMAEDIHYSDPTAAYFDGQAIEFNNRAETKKFWAESFKRAQVDTLSYDVQSCFTAGSVTVLNLKLTINQGGHFWRVNKETIRLQGTHIMTLEFEGDRIKKQVDLVDYAEVTRQVEQLQQEFGRLDP